MVCPAVDNPVRCKLGVVVYFLHAKNRVPQKFIVNYVISVYGQNVMNEGTVRQWHRMFTVGQTNVHGKE
jgi:hypothetical protein